MTVVLSGSFEPARRIASRATASATPSSSKSTRPGRTSNTKYFGSPLPEPMPTSAGFIVIGRSGKMRIQSLPPLPVARVRTLRAASIWLLVTREAVVAFMPWEPNATVVPRVSGRARRSGLFRPVCHLRCFTFLGNNIRKYYARDAGRGSVTGRAARSACVSPR